MNNLKILLAQKGKKPSELANERAETKKHDRDHKGSRVRFGCPVR